MFVTRRTEDTEKVRGHRPGATMAPEPMRTVAQSQSPTLRRALANSDGHVVECLRFLWQPFPSVSLRSRELPTIPCNVTLKTQSNNGDGKR